MLKNVMFYDFIYLAKGFRMRPKVRSTLIEKETFVNVFWSKLVLVDVISLLHSNSSHLAFDTELKFDNRDIIKHFRLSTLLKW